MDTAQRTDNRDEPLNDSWVELHFQNQLGRSAATTEKSGEPPSYSGEPPSFSRPISIHNGQMEKLLLEAQKEGSRSSSRVPSTAASTASSRGSPKSPHSPNNELASLPIGTIQEGPIGSGAVLGSGQEADWIWDWSSRPEALPPSQWGSQFKHPRRARLSVRNTGVMRSGPFCLENLPTLLLTHACTFIMGAAVMFMYLKKYCNWAVVTTQMD